MDALKSRMGDLLPLITNQPLTSISTIAAATLLPLAIIAYRDYRAYIALGPHGLPDTFQGYLKQLQWAPKARKDVTVPAPYGTEAVEASGPNALRSFFARPLQRRAGPRPDVCGFVAPQRQYDQRASPERARQMHAYLAALAEANSAVLQLRNSVFEGPIPSVFIRDHVARPVALRGMRGETAHIHPPDGSTHLLLSLADQKEFIEKGWGERHRLSGSDIVPWNYSFLYAPRNDDEFEVWKDVVCSAAKFCCSLDPDAEVKSPVVS